MQARRSAGASTHLLSPAVSRLRMHAPASTASAGPRSTSRATGIVRADERSSARRRRAGFTADASARLRFGTSLAAGRADRDRDASRQRGGACRARAASRRRHAHPPRFCLRRSKTACLQGFSVSPRRRRAPRGGRLRRAADASATGFSRRARSAVRPRARRAPRAGTALAAENRSRTFAQIGLCDAKSAGAKARNFFFRKPPPIAASTRAMRTRNGCGNSPNDFFVRSETRATLGFQSDRKKTSACVRDARACSSMLATMRARRGRGGAAGKKNRRGC